jgi:hypothetical protein
MEIQAQDKRQELLFASHYAFGMAIPEALLAAGFGSRSIAVGLQLLRKPHVEEHIDETRNWIKSKLVETQNTILQALDRDRDLAYVMKNPSAAVAATMAKAKVMGFLDPDANAKTPKKITIVWGEEEPVAE